MYMYVISKILFEFLDLKTLEMFVNIMNIGPYKSIQEVYIPLR